MNIAAAKDITPCMKLHDGNFPMDKVHGNLDALSAQCMEHCKHGDQGGLRHGSNQQPQHLLKSGKRARLFGNVTESVGEGKWMVRWDDAPADVQDRGTIVTWSVVSDTGTPTEIPSIPATSSPASILATEPLPADNLDMSAESQDSQPCVELAKELGDSSGEEEAPEQYVGGASPDDGHEDAAWISPAPGTSVVLKQGSKIATLSVFNLDSAEEMAKMRDTTAQREAARTLPVGLRDGLPIGVGSVDLVQLWVMMYPGDLSADMEKVNAAGLRRSSTQKLISMREYVRFWELVIAGALYSQQGRDLWATNITFDGLRDQPNFQRYMPLHRFKYIRSLIKYAKADLDSTVRRGILGRGSAVLQPSSTPTARLS
eukprot:jgi/Tetstr1/440154/TSEL_028511.t1